MGEPLGSAEECCVAWRLLRCLGGAGETRGTQDRWAQAGQAAGLEAPAPQATRRGKQAGLSLSLAWVETCCSLSSAGMKWYQVRQMRGAPGLDRRHSLCRVAGDRGRDGS